MTKYMLDFLYFSHFTPIFGAEMGKLSFLKGSTKLLGKLAIVAIAHALWVVDRDEPDETEE